MSRVTRRLAINASIIFSGDTLATFIGALFFLYVARSLGLQLFGKYSFLQNTIMILSVVTTFGFSQVIVKTIAGRVYSKESVLSNVLAIRFLLSILAIIILNVYFFILRYPAEMVLLGNLFILVLFPRAFVESIRSVFQALEKMFPVSSLLVAARVLLIILGITAVELGFSLGGIVFAHVAAMTVMSGVGVYLLRHHDIHLGKLEWRRSKELLRQALPFGLAGLLTQIYFRIDIQMLEPMSGVEAVGIYNSAYQFIAVMVLLPGAISKTVFPRLTMMFQSEKKSFETIVRSLVPVLSFMVVLVVVPFYIYAPEIIDITFGEPYRESHTALQVLIWSLIPISINNILNVALFSANLQKYVTLNSLICVLLNISLNLILIPYYGYLGAALATVMTESTLLLLLLFWLNKHLFRYYPFIWFLKFIFSAVLTTWGLSLIKQIGVAFPLIGFLLAAPVLYFIILPKKDREQIPSLLSLNRMTE